MRPLIGVMPLFDTEKQSIWMLPAYLEGILQGGGTPIILPFGLEGEAAQALFARCDGFLFTGGHDVQPHLYGEETLAFCSEVSPERDALEEAALTFALREDKPVLGICRGLQFLNVHLGGSLYQDIGRQMERPIPLAHGQQKPYHIPIHSVDVLGATPLEKVLGAGKHRVNSCHHQGIKKLAAPLSPAAMAPDGLVEAAFLPGHRYCLAVQWHPEYLLGQGLGAEEVFNSFCACCGK